MLEDDVRITYRHVGTPAKSILVKPNAARAAYVTERVTRRGDWTFHRRNIFLACNLSRAAGVWIERRPTVSPAARSLRRCPNSHRRGLP